MKEELLNFLKSQRLMTIASAEGGIWIASVYYGVDDDFKLYFISPLDTKHSKQILADPNIAFSIAWFNPDNHADRKAVQGLGVCRAAKNILEIGKGVMLHNQNFPVFAKRITLEWIRTNAWKSRVWVVEPKYMKFWNDELYKEEEFEEFNV